MDPNTIQQLTQLLQQMLQVVQAAGGTPATPPATGATPPPAGAPPMGDSDGDEYDDVGDDDDDEMGDDEDNNAMGGGASGLHDRISKLEAHTGLKKAASNVPLVDRLDALEDHWLGEQFAGAAVDRLLQLEGVALKKAAVAGKKPATTADDDAPDVINLGDLIKSAVTEGIKLGLQAQQAVDDEEELPDPATLRKQARSAPQFSQRRGQRPAVTGDEALTKAAQQWGLTDEELDSPVSFGDYLQFQYRTGAGRASLPLGDDD